MSLSSDFPLILALHRIGYPPANARIRGLFTSPKLLRFELHILKSLGYRFCTLSDAFLFPRPRTAVITFDDGYRDNLTAAEKILGDFGAPATLFVVTSDVGKSNVVWGEADEKLPAEMLSWEELRTLSSLGWEIGSHSHFHVHLERRSVLAQRDMIAKSIEAIDENLGFRPRTFAYPYGSYSSITKNLLRELGFSYAVTTRSPSSGEPFDFDSLELPRISVGGRHLLHYFRAANRTRLALQSNGSFDGVVIRLGSRALLSALGSKHFSARDNIMP
ncbi:MAG: hypothetical protein C4324_10840 [Blastocatellia bacterium]